MDIKDYSTKLRQLKDGTPQNMADLADWTELIALPWLWTELGGTILTRKAKHPMASVAPAFPQLKPVPVSAAVRQGLMTSVADQLTLDTEVGFYQAQMTMLDSEAKHYCVAIKRFTQEQAQGTKVFAEEAVVHTLHRALLEMMSYAQIMLEDAGREISDVHGFFGAWRSKRDHYFQVFKGTEQSIYGTYSGMTHVDRAPHLPVATLRTAIEIRLRNAFCIYSLVNSTNPEDTVPIDMGRLFEAIQKRQTDIEFAVDLHDVWRVYRWSNFYLHGGFRDFPWVVGFLLQYLRPIFAPPANSSKAAWSMDGGIRMKRETWHAVRAELGAQKTEPDYKQRLKEAWATLFPRKKMRNLELPEFDETQAQCIFLDQPTRDGRPSQ